MEATTIELDRSKARELWRDYQKHRHYSQPIDQEIARTYQAIAQGKVVIRALDSIKAAGLGEDKLPKLAIVRADAKRCWLGTRSDGSAWFAATEGQMFSPENFPRGVVSLPAGSFPGIATEFPWRRRPVSIVPTIPLPLRPKRGLQNYHILYEAEWDMTVPIDPMLLRRMGKGDLWVVFAAWELSPIEQAALAGHTVRA